jgi:hypothetical protein
LKLTEAFSHVERGSVTHSHHPKENQMEVDSESNKTTDLEDSIWGMGVDLFKDNLNASTKGAKILAQLIDDILFQI